MVPIIEFSDMFCCEQLSPNESKQICDLQPYLEVRLCLGDMGLIFRNPVGCVCSVSQGPASSVFEYGYLCASWAPECAAMGKCLDWPGKNKTNTLSQISVQYQKHVWERSWFTLPALGPTYHSVGWERNCYALLFLLTRECVCVWNAGPPPCASVSPSTVQQQINTIQPNFMGLPSLPQHVFPFSVPSGWHIHRAHPYTWLLPKPRAKLIR